MTYGDIISEFTQKFPNLDYEDIRPCWECYGVPKINYAIVVWLKDKSKIIYISDKARESDDIINLCAEKGIDVKITNEEILREIHITFSKENKHFRQIIPYDKYYVISETFINQLVKEAENELNH